MFDEWFWLWTPICASIVLSMILVPLGERVLQRGVVFADIAIAQWAALGVLVGGQLLWMRSWEAIFPALSISGLGFALLASWFVHLILRYFASHREAMIGSLYVAGASLATMSVSHDPHGAQALAATLNGDLLWASSNQLFVLIPIVLAVGGWHGLTAKVKERCFLPLFALAVTVAVEVAGVYVVFATLISAPLMLCRIAKKPLSFAISCCVIAHFMGLILAACMDYPVGPTVVLSSIVFSMIVLIVLQTYKYIRES